MGYECVKTVPGVCSLNKCDHVNNCGIRICSQIKEACVVILNFQLLEELDNDVNLKWPQQIFVKWPLHQDGIYTLRDVFPFYPCCH